MSLKERKRAVLKLFLGKHLVLKMAKLKVTLKKSLIGRLDSHIKTANALGLKKIRDEKIHNDTPQIRGMVNKVSYLVDCEEV